MILNYVYTTIKNWSSKHSQIDWWNYVTILDKLQLTACAFWKNHMLFGQMTAIYSFNGQKHVKILPHSLLLFCLLVILANIEWNNVIYYEYPKV